MRRSRNAKIVATLGPASSTKEVVRQLFMSGADVFRLNFSHGSADDHRARFAILRELEAETGRPIAVLADLQGPKLRVGTFADGPITLGAGAAFRLDLDPDAGRCDPGRPAAPRDLRGLVPGTDTAARRRQAAADGRPTAAPTSPTRAVVVGGKLSERKGVNVPGVVLPITR